MNKINKYREWVKLNESKNADGVYITLTFKDYSEDEIIKIQTNLIEEIFSRFSDCNIEKITTENIERSRFKKLLLEISLVEDSDFEMFGSLGISENIKLSSPILLSDMSFIGNDFPKSFKKITLIKSKSVVFSIDPNNFNKTDDELIDLIINNINVKNRVKFNSQSIRYSPGSPSDELTNDHLNEALLETDKDKRSKLINKLNVDLEYTVYLEYYKSQAAKSLLSISRKTINLEEYQNEVEQKINILKDKSLNLTNFTEDERYSFIREIILLQKYLGKSCDPLFIESKIASRNLLKIYEILDSVEIPETELDIVSQEILKK